MPSACDFFDIAMQDLLCKSFLHGNCASNAFYRTKKASLRMLLGFGSTLLRKANARSQVRNDYFVSPSCTATAHATDCYAPKKHPCGCFWVFGAICYANNLALLCAQLILSNLLGLRLRKQRLHQPSGYYPCR